MSPAGRFYGPFSDEICAIDNTGAELHTDMFITEANARLWLSDDTVSAKEANIPKKEIKAWLTEHETACKDAVNHFEKQLGNVSLTELHAWIKDHDELYRDYQTHFNVLPVDKDISEAFDTEDDIEEDFDL